MKSSRVILDLCGGTGAWSQPYKDAGYSVYNITLPEYDILHTTFRQNTLVFRPAEYKDSLHYVLELRYDEIYGILAAPPCTMFSVARSTGGKRDLRGALSVVEMCQKIVRECLLVSYDSGKFGHLKFWAMENPKGYLQKLIGRPTFEFSPWEFGDPYFKNTQVWGYFNKPEKTPTQKPGKFQRQEWGNPKKPAKYAHLKLKRSDIRAITPEGFARAFYLANK